MSLIQQCLQQHHVPHRFLARRRYLQSGERLGRSKALATFVSVFAIVSLPGQICIPCFAGQVRMCKPFGRQALDPVVPNHRNRCLVDGSSSSSSLAATGQLGVLSVVCVSLGRWCRCCGHRALAAAAAAASALTISITTAPLAHAGVNVIPDASIAGSSSTVATRRVVSIGDLHGDFEQAKFILERLGLMAKDGSWAGGGTLLVQTGDVTDRGDASGPIFETLFRLQDEAPRQGGEVILLLGNHEVMNMQGDFRYATQMDTKSLGTSGGRSEAFAPEGWIGRRLRDRAKTVVLLNKEHGIAKPVLFAHAGVVPEFARVARDAAGPEASAAEVAEALNRIGRDVLAGDESVLRRSDSPLLRDSGPFWTRELALRSEATACQKLDEVLQTFGAARMVVGHTPQEDGRVHTRCGGRLVLGDTLISAAYTGVAHPAALEISSDGSMTAVYPKTGERSLLPLGPAQSG